MGIIKVKQSFMPHIQYSNKADSKSLVESFAPLLKNYEINILKKFTFSNRLNAEYTNTNNDQP